MSLNLVSMVVDFFTIMRNFTLNLVHEEYRNTNKVVANYLFANNETK